MDKKTIIVSAFAPFGGEAINPTELILKKLPDYIGKIEIKKLYLPVEFIKAPKILIDEYDNYKPKAVIMLGQAGGREKITIEAIAKNLMNAKISDNSSFKPTNLEIVKDGKGELSATLPIEELISEVEKLNIKVSKSEDAGSYVCNCLMYGMLNHNNGEVPTGFIHVPFIKEQGKTPYMDLIDEYNGIVTIVSYIASII